MGTLCSKLHKKKSKQYEKKDEHEKKRDNKDKKHHKNKKPHRHPKQPIGGSGKRKGRGQPSQPTQDESNVNYAINNGSTKENNKGNDENMRENNYVRPNIGDQMENDEIMKDNNYIRPNVGDQKKVDGNKGNNQNERRRGKRNKKHKRNSYSSDSSWSSSSSSTSSSSEDEGNGKTVKSRQKKRNNDGSVTYIRNKTTIGSSKISFKAAKNINIYHNYKNNAYMAQPKSEKPRKLFTKEYTETSAKDEERHLFSLFQGQTPSPGQFVDLRGRENVQPAIDYGLLYRCSRWVGQINFPKGHCTCFRVGTKYIMTALHSIREILRGYDDFMPINRKLPQAELLDISILSSGEVTVDFNYEVENQPSLERRKFKFKRIEREEEIPFLDYETDTIVLELEENPNQPLPPQFTNFGIPKLDKAFNLITHSNGDPKSIDRVNKIVDINDPQTIEDIKILKSKSNEHMEKHGMDASEHKCETDPYDTIANRSRLLFHCASGKGASGSPGVQTGANGKLVVVTMLLHGYPDWYYDKDCEALKTGWPDAYTIEQGVNFAAVYSEMKRRNVTLCKNIFPAEETSGCISRPLHVLQPTDAK